MNALSSLPPAAPSSWLLAPGSDPDPELAAHGLLLTALAAMVDLMFIQQNNLSNRRGF